MMVLIFAVIGISLLKGQFYQCDEDDGTIITKQDCLDKGLGWSRNDSNFDDIVQAMRTLFILTTSEGWAGVMFLGVDTAGIDMQPKSWSNPWICLYFILFMVIGSLFVMNMFIGVVID